MSDLHRLRRGSIVTPASAGWDHVGFEAVPLAPTRSPSATRATASAASS